MSRARRWFWVQVLRWRGWPDPEAALDWLDRRQAWLEQEDDP